MTTQSLRGLADAGPMHWRGDKSGAGLGIVNDPATHSGSYDEQAAFKKFNPAFVNLLGRGAKLDESPGGELDQFTAFALGIHYPPNPIRPFDDFSADASVGKDFFENTKVDGPIGTPVLTCASCHALPLGTNAKSNEEGETQQFKIPHLRNLYQKIGMFGVSSFGLAGPQPFQGDQIRGFGFLHDGGVDTLFSFLHAPGFTMNDVDRRHVEQFLLEFDTGLAAVVGQQMTVTSGKLSGTDTLRKHAEAGDCDLIARGFLSAPVAGARERGYWYHPDSSGAFGFEPDVSTESRHGFDELINLQLKPGGWLTLTCVPPGSGHRMGIDRDCQKPLDGDTGGTSLTSPIDYTTTPCL